MRLTQKQLRRLIEAEVKNEMMQNDLSSRDHIIGDLGEVDEGNKIDVHGDIAAVAEHLQSAVDLMNNVIWKDDGELDSNMRFAVKKLRDYLVSNEWVETFKSNR